ncbi:MAG: cell wall-binding repeat-containing protein, partial [Firmicutes bacterium]|nr:cell wall-binding repeat-containing protein [Bacillota bacterium]
APAVGLAITPSGKGGWILSADGSVTPVGNAPALNPGLPGGVAAVAIATSRNHGVAVLAANGTIYGAGTLAGTWSTGISRPVGLAADPNGGFWVLGQDGTVAAVAGAPQLGGLQAVVNATGQTPAAIAPTPDGGGYYVLTADGRVYPFGDAYYPAQVPRGIPARTAAVSLAVVGPYHPYGLINFAYWYPSGTTLNDFLSYETVIGQNLNLISPHWFGVGGNGQVYGPTDIGPVVAQMQAQGLQVVPMFGRSFGDALGPLASPGSQETLVANIVQAVDTYHLNGVNLDFEGLPSGSAGYLDTFVQKLKAALGPQRLLVVDVYPDWVAYRNLSGQLVPGYQDSVYDYGYLSAFADYLVVMAYPMWWNPGPLSSLTHDRGIINYILAGGPNGTPAADPNKVLFGIPGYARIWAGISGAGHEPSTTVPQIENVLRQAGVTPAYDAQAGEYYAHYTVPFSVPPTLNPGDASPAVVALQYALNQLLASPAQYGAASASAPLPAEFPLPLDGQYGPETTQAVYAFQQDWQVTGDTPGVFGSATRQTLASIASAYPQAFASGIPMTTWFENAAANAAHAQLVQQSGLPGVALWSLGEASNRYFSTLASSVDLAANPQLTVRLSRPTLYSGTVQTETVTVTQGSGFPVAGLTVSLGTASGVTDGQGQVSLTVTPAAQGPLPVTVNDPAGQTVATATALVVDPSVNTTAFAGVDRFATAADLALHLYRQASTVVLARGDQFPDALAGAVLAHHLGAPILLTLPDSLPSETLAALYRLGARQVVLLGGPDAISQAVAGTLQNNGFTVTRYAGATRYGTADAIAMAVGAPADHTAVIATGSDFPDALSIAPIAAARGWPLLLATQSTTQPLTTNTLDTLQALGITRVYIIGSPGSVPSALEGVLANLGIQSTRISGKNGFYSTNLAVLQTFAPGLNLTHLFAATGNNFSDALSASPVAAALGTGILLVPGTSGLQSTQSSWLAAQKGRIGVIDIAGGPDAVHPQVALQLSQALN